MKKRIAPTLVGVAVCTVAVACTTATKPSIDVTRGNATSAGNRATANSPVIKRKGKAAVTERQAETTFYERAKAGFQANIPDFFKDDEFGGSITNLNVEYQAAKVKPLATKAEADGSKAAANAGHPHREAEFESETDDSPDTPTENYADEPGELEGHADMMVGFRSGTPHRIRVLEEDLPPMSSGSDEALYVDETSGKRMKFAADQDFVAYAANDGTNALRITVNPDGTLTIDDQPAGTLQQASEMVLAKPICRNASREILLALYGGMKHRREAIETLNFFDTTKKQNEAGPDDPPDLLSLMRAILKAL